MYIYFCVGLGDGGRRRRSWLVKRATLEITVALSVCGGGCAEITAGVHCTDRVQTRRTEMAPIIGTDRILRVLSRSHVGGLWQFPDPIISLFAIRRRAL